MNKVSSPYCALLLLFSGDWGLDTENYSKEDVNENNIFSIFLPEMYKSSSTFMHFIDMTIIRFGGIAKAGVFKVEKVVIDILNGSRTQHGLHYIIT